MHRPSVASVLAALVAITHDAHGHSVRGPQRHCVVRSCGRRAAAPPRTRVSLALTEAGLRACAGAAGSRPARYACGSGSTTAILPPSSPHLHTSSRRGAMGAGVRSRLFVVSCAVTATSSASASTLLCARRWATAGRRPTYQEITEALATLKVDINDDARTMKKRYRELVKAHHPDAGGDEATMSKITVAYERLESLSKREKEEFLLQRKMYGGAGGGGTNPYQARAAYTGRRGGSPFGYAYGNTGGGADNDPFRNAAGASGHYYQGADPFAEARAQQQSYWNHFNRQKGSGATNFTANPFGGGNPFSMHGQMRRARFMPSGTLFVQGLVLYMFVTFLFLLAYRAYRDYRHDDGWRMSESLARHEQLQELHRLRQAMNERARQMQAGQDADGLNRPLRANETAESRAIEYARQRRIQEIQAQRQQQQMNSGALPELRGWPKITEEQGRITKRAQDPPGVVFYEPTREDARLRQIRNQRRTDSSVSSWKAKANSAAEAEQAAQSASATEGMIGPSPGVVAGLMGSHGTDPSRPLPPESNVSGVFASQVSNNAETREALNSILGLVRRAASEQEAQGK